MAFRAVGVGCSACVSAPIFHAVLLINPPFGHLTNKPCHFATKSIHPSIHPSSAAEYSDDEEQQERFGFGREDAQQPFVDQEDASEDERESFVDHSGRGRSRNPSKRSSKSRRRSESEDSDQAPGRTPLGSKFHQNRINQRFENHPDSTSMKTRRTASAKGGKVSKKPAAKKGDKASKPAAKKTPKTKQVLPTETTQQRISNKKAKKRKTESESEDESTQIQKLISENQKLRAISAAAAASGSRSKGGKKQPLKAGTESATVKEIQKVTKQFLFPKVKVLKNEKELLRATRIIMEHLDLQNHNGLEGQDLDTAQQIWINEHKEYVRQAINSARNYVNQEVQKVIGQAVENGRLHTYPDVETIKKCALRDDIQDLDDEGDLTCLKLPQAKEEPDDDYAARVAKCQDLEARIAERDKMRVKFDNYLDFLLPKVSGFKHYGPKSRYHFVPSYTMRGPQEFDQEGDPDVPLVTASDEAFLVALFENSYKRWKYCKECELDSKEEDKKHPDWDTKYTNLKGGQKLFGGWETVGRKRINFIKGEIDANRKENKKYVIEVEQAAIKRLRALNKLSPDVVIGTKKRKAPAVLVAEESESECSFLAESEEEEEDDDDDDE